MNKAKGQKRPVNKKFTELKKEKKRQYHREQYRNLSKDQKQRLVEYRSYYFITYNKKLTTEFTLGIAEIIYFTL